MYTILHANLDAEATWSGVPLPPAVAARISLLGTLAALLVEPGRDVELWTPAPVDAARVRFGELALRVGVPARADVVWADPEARRANDRRWAQRIAALPGARTIASLDEVPDDGAWIAKLPWTAAGRDRVRWTGAPAMDVRTRLARLLARCGELVVEPWCERLADAGQCATVDASGAVVAMPPHGLIVDGRGGFVGIELAPALEASELAELAKTVARVGAELARIGYAGPYGVDAFAYRAGGERRFHPLCEINARYTFGRVAHAVARRFGAARLGFGAAPDGARTLIAPGGSPGNDGVTAWCA